MAIYIAILVVSIYSNTFSASWHLDDYPNIVNNSRLHLTSLSAETIYNATHANPAGGVQLYRPVACLSFAINWYLSGENLFGFHLANILVHALTAIILFATIFNMLSAPTAPEMSGEKKLFVALLTALLWSCHPIQTQAVTYIVQRMASLAALFSLLAIYYYLKGRTALSGRLRVVFWSLSFLFFVFAVGSKENALILPLNIFLVEVFFFKNLRDKHYSNVSGYLFAGAIFGVLSVVGYKLLAGVWPSISYEGKTFTLGERLLTEPRIVLYYLSQIFYPLPGRFSITHDITISSSLFRPWSTATSIIIILIIIVFAVKNSKRLPLLSFSVIFFFINHLVESSVFPLELIYEHRNYLPTLFLFLPVASGLCYLIFDKYVGRIVTRSIIVFFVCIILITLSVGTLSRNMVWASEKTLWTDAMQKAPFSARPYDNLAWGYYMRVGGYDTAIMLYKRALTLWDANKHHRALMYNNLGGIYFQAGHYDEAINHWKKSIQVVDKFWKPHYGICRAYIKKGNWEEALKEATNSLESGMVSSELSFLRGLIFLRLKEPRDALLTFGKLTRIAGLSEKARVGMGLSLLMMNDYSAAIKLLSSVFIRNPNNIESLLGLVAAESSLGNAENAIYYIDKILMIFPDREVIAKLDKIFNDNAAFPFPQGEILSVVKQRVRDRARQLIISLDE